ARQCERAPRRAGASRPTRASDPRSPGRLPVMIAITVAAVVAAYLTGWFLWTFAEYLMHRFAMHEMKGRGMASREHLTHHAERDSVLEKWAVAWSGVVGLGIAIGVNAARVLPAPVALSLALGWVG